MFYRISSLATFVSPSPTKQCCGISGGPAVRFCSPWPVPGQAVNVSQLLVLPKTTQQTNKIQGNKQTKTSKTASVGATEAVEIAPVYEINTGRDVLAEVIVTKSALPNLFQSQQKPAPLRF